MAAFKLSFSIQKKFKEKKFSGEIVFALIKDIIYGTLYIFVFISFFMNKYKSLQGGQLPWDNLPFLQNLLNFVITKNLKQEVYDNLSICMDEHSPSGLLIIGDTKIYQCQKVKR